MEKHSQDPNNNPNTHQLDVAQIASYMLQDSDYHGQIVNYLCEMFLENPKRRNSWDAWFRGASDEWMAEHDGEPYDPTVDKHRMDNNNGDRNGRK